MAHYTICSRRVKSKFSPPAPSPCGRPRRRPGQSGPEFAQSGPGFPLSGPELRPKWAKIQRPCFANSRPSGSMWARIPQSGPPFRTPPPPASRRGPVLGQSALKQMMGGIEDAGAIHADGPRPQSPRPSRTCGGALLSTHVAAPHLPPPTLRLRSGEALASGGGRGTGSYRGAAPFSSPPLPSLPRWGGGLVAPTARPRRPRTLYHPSPCCQEERYISFVESALSRAAMRSDAVGRYNILGPLLLCSLRCEKWRSRRHGRPRLRPSPGCDPRKEETNHQEDVRLQPSEVPAPTRPGVGGAGDWLLRGRRLTTPHPPLHVP